MCAHPDVHDVSLRYGQLGVALSVRRFDGSLADDEVGIFPPSRRGEVRAALERTSTAVLTGWAVESWGARRYGADLAFPVSDHADFRGLIDYAKATGAREVMTVHGFADELAAALRAEGVFARSAHQTVQLQLPLGLGEAGDRQQAFPRSSRLSP